MALPSFISGKKDEEFFVSFVVGKNWVQGGVWNVQENKGTLIAAGTTSPWQEDPSVGPVPDGTGAGGPDSFVEAADDSLSSALGGLDEEPKLEKVVFGLPTPWIEAGKVKQDKLNLLKKLCDTLEFKPSGFVVIPEALVFAIRQKEEGAGLSFILVGLVEDEIEITNVRAGKIVDATTVARSISLGDDVAEGLARFGTEGLPAGQAGLPARIILYNRHVNELNEIKNELSSWEWASSNFTHTPRIETLPPDGVITAVSEAGAVEVAHATKFIEEPLVEGGETSADSKLSVTSLSRSQTTQDREKKDKEMERPKEQKIEEVQESLQTPRKFSIPFYLISSFGGGKSRGFAILLTLLVLLTVAAFVFLPRATLTVYLHPQKLEERLDVIVSPTGEQNGKLAGRVAAGELTGEKTKATSGRKTVGDRAKGEAVIFNNTASSRSFAAGTIITGPNGLKFFLDSPVTVASESGAPVYKPGEAKGKVAAGDIGSEYNLAPGNIFSIANFSTSSFSARNDTAFAGGSSRAVASVEKDDQDRLERELIRELEEKTLSELHPQLGPSEILIPQSSKTSVVSRSFSAKPGDETETLNLRLTVRTDFIALGKDQLESYIRTAISNKIPPGLVLQSGLIEVAFSSSKETEGNDRHFTLNVIALLLPDINKKELANKISGKTPNDAQNELLQLPGFVRSAIKLSPALPGPFYRLPIKPDNIALEILPER